MTKKQDCPTPEIAHLLDMIDQYKRAAGDLADKTVSYRIFRDAKKVGLLRADGDITTRSYHAALEWITANWPEGIERPACSAPMPATPALVGEKVSQGAA